jgi:hypothetical protein
LGGENFILLLMSPNNLPETPQIVLPVLHSRLTVWVARLNFYPGGIEHTTAIKHEN